MVPSEILTKMAEANPELTRRIGPMLHERPDLAYFVLSGQSTFARADESEIDQRSVAPTPSLPPAPTPSREIIDDDRDASADLAAMAAKSAGVTLPTRAPTTDAVPEHAPDAGADLLTLAHQRVSERDDTADKAKAHVAAIFDAYGTDPEAA